jgi:CP4-57 regulatory protein AlpA
MNIKLLRLPAVRDKTGLRNTQIYDKMQRGTFPLQIEMGSDRSLGSNPRSMNGSRRESLNDSITSLARLRGRGSHLTDGPGSQGQAEDYAQAIMKSGPAMPTLCQ